MERLEALYRTRIRQLRLSMLIALVVALVIGCAWWQQTGKKTVRTVDDLARGLCIQYFSEKAGLSLEDVARQYCSQREQWAPWIDEVLYSIPAGAQPAGLPARGQPAAPACPPPSATPAAPAVAPSATPEPLLPSPGGETSPQTPPALAPVGVWGGLAPAAPA